MPDSVLSVEAFSKLTQQLVGLTVALPGKAYGSSIYLELGRLTTIKSKRRDYALGEACISVSWDWRVEHNSTVLYGSSNSGQRIERGISELQDSRVECISVMGVVPELVVTFSNGHILRSMVMVTGDPEWSVRLPDDRWVFARAGELLVGMGESTTSEEEKGAFLHAERTATRWGIPIADPVLGTCRHCNWFKPIDGEGCLLDYGVCTSNVSPFDGRAVNFASGCQEFLSEK